jgi:rhodanese-related sulfurtransferase
MNLPRILCLLIALSTAVFAATAPKIPATDAAKLVAEGKAVLVDCREPGEWKDNGVAAPAELLPKSDFDGDQKLWKEFLAKNSGKQVLIYCRSGGRAGTVANALAEKGINAASVGGLKNWTDAGLPTRAADAPKAPANPNAKPETKK